MLQQRRRVSVVVEDPHDEVTSPVIEAARAAAASSQSVLNAGGNTTCTGGLICLCVSYLNHSTKSYLDTLRKAMFLLPQKPYFRTLTH